MVFFFVIVYIQKHPEETKKYLNEANKYSSNSTNYEKCDIYRILGGVYYDEVYIIIIIYLERL